jgi:hypothetical protein
MNAKEQKIKEAYGEYWETVKDYVGENGWINDFYLPYNINKEKFPLEHFANLWRPKPLSGIENNNGWIRIESEADLPKENIDIDWYYGGRFLNNKDFIELSYRLDFVKIKEHYKNKIITHYQPIFKTEKPIY